MPILALDENFNFDTLNFNEDHDFESRPIDFKNHFSDQEPPKFEKKQKESVKVSKLKLEQPKTVEHVGYRSFGFHEIHEFQSRPVEWVNFEHFDVDKKLNMQKKEYKNIIAPKKIAKMKTLQEKQLLKINRAKEIENLSQKNEAEVNAALDRIVLDFNS